MYLQKRQEAAGYNNNDVSAVPKLVSQKCTRMYTFDKRQGLEGHPRRWKSDSRFFLKLGAVITVAFCGGDVPKEWSRKAEPRKACFLRCIAKSRPKIKIIKLKEEA